MRRETNRSDSNKANRASFSPKKKLRLNSLIGASESEAVS
jgi:hypothetical protein